MAFSADSPSAAKGYDLAAYVQTQLTAISSTSQVNADLLTDFAALSAVMQTVVDSVGS